MLAILFSSAAFPAFVLASDIQTGLSDDQLLDLISRKAFDYFQMEKDRATGLVRDRASNFRRGSSNAPASIAATGFGLTALGVGVERGWIDKATAQESARRTLEFFWKQAPQEHGFFYHFLDPRTGKRSAKSELSPIDTALFLAGALFVAEYFDDPGLRQLTDQIYGRVDWPWMMHDGKTLALAWSPEEGFNRRRWDHYDESMILYLLAIGSSAHPIDASAWKEIARPVGSYAGYRVIQMPPLFTHQYSHIWIDFRNKNDGFADYFQNSINAARANREFCIRQSSRFSSYGPNSWGLTASDGPFGYKAYGAPPGWAIHDGTVAPTACGSSIVFTPDESMACLRHFYEELGDQLWGSYGFSDAFNLDKKWFSDQALAIDQGPLLLMIENHRSGLIWEVMKKNRNLAEAMQKVGFREGTKDVPWPDPPRFNAPFLQGGVKIDGYLKDWPGFPPLVLGPQQKENGNFSGEKDIRANVRFAWSREALYFSVIVTDDSVMLKRQGNQIWQDDMVELYIDPQNDGLRWKDPSDYQIGFRPNFDSENIEIWSWFQANQDQIGNMVAARGFAYGDGYVIEGGIRWSVLGVEPEEAKTVKVSIAVHDIDKDRSEGKVNWFFRNEEDLERFNLGEVVLSPASAGSKPVSAEPPPTESAGGVS